MTKSSTAQLEKLLKKKRCPRCGKKRLVPRFPHLPLQARCLNCGALFKMTKEGE